MLVSTEVSFHLYNNFFFSVVLFLGYFVMDDEIFVSKKCICVPISQTTEAS